MFMSNMFLEEPISEQCDDIEKVGVVERKPILELEKLKTGDQVTDHFKTHYWYGAEFIGKYQLLKLKTVVVRDLPKEDEVISFSEMLSSKYRDKLSKYWIDMFNNDVVIERFWRNPEKYLPLLKQAKGVIAADYSVMNGLLLTDNIYNVQRNRISAYMMERERILTIPVASWTDEESFEWCFDGLPHHSVIAISSNGCLKGECKTAKETFIKGVFELNRRKSPVTILICGPHIKELDSLTNIRYYKSYSQRLYERLQNNG